MKISLNKSELGLNMGQIVMCGQRQDAYTQHGTKEKRQTIESLKKREITNSETTLRSTRQQCMRLRKYETKEQKSLKRQKTIMGCT